ncbi:tol-pal system protein YbgF [Amphiplicatus metriothermophilus]|uniref:Cell division coordinator CpoB n=1 Tax=Amphiplicatus metriothermophilus TaxID=1519374 RepID=A0A239PYV6_9PROT|nr:tol-pal system protein YbgF [Amphiplicatus metriothermophilus]MBB5518178.1 tol-pal system protein YbgF [Amphiplicatus metriothermophilus]SNT75340.1 tol-pal system protein YbgF [Amphiplicatus metriothermophilus]
MRGKISVLLASGVLAMAGACASGPAAAQSTKERLTALEQAVADLQARAPAAADTSVRLGQLQEQIQELTGRIEELSYELERTQARLDAVSAALAGGAEGADGAAATGGPVALGPGGDPIAERIAEASGEESDVALPFDPDEAFSYASGFLLRGDYARAEEAFELYLEAFPNHPRTADAQFRLGEIYLATGKNADAADAFIAHIKKYPNDSRAAEAYLKLGTAFARLGQTGEACQVFKSMRSKFPNASQPVRDRADLEMSRINCR